MNHQLKLIDNSARSEPDPALLLSGKRIVSTMVRLGARPEDVARFVQSLPVYPGAALSRAIEDLSEPGTIAEAIFNILAD